MNTLVDEDEEADDDFVAEDVANEELVLEEEEKLEEKKPAADSVDQLSESFCIMSVSKTTSGPCSMAISFPYIQYGFIEGNRRRVCVDFLIYGMSKKDYRLKVINGGKALQLGMVVPSFFTDPNRLQIANEDDTGFNTRAHKAIVFQEVVSKLNDALDNEEPLLADPMKVSLLYPCEDEFEWEVLGFENDDLEWNESMEHQQHFFILSVDLISTIKVGKQKKKGGFRMLGSPNKQGNKNGNGQKRNEGEFMEDDGQHEE